jgi:acyl-CoA thioesterase FadM
MASTVVVIGTSARAAGWATRFLAAGFEVGVDDETVVAAVAERWPQADRLGLFPGASLARLSLWADLCEQREIDLAQVVDGEMPIVVWPTLTATEETARAHEPIHLLPLVEVSGDHAEELSAFYAAIGMAPRSPSTPSDELARFGPAIAELCNGDADAIIAVMRALRPSGIGAGAAMAAHEAARFAAGATTPWQPGSVPEAPLDLYATRVEPDWVDYNGHMTEAAYLTAAGWASDALFRYIGDDEAYRSAGHSFYTVETHINYLLEVDVHEPIRFTTQMLGADAKRMHLFHSMYHGDTGALMCTCEQMLLHVDMNAGRSAPMLPDVRAAVDAIAATHASLPRPTQVGSVMQLPPPRP